MAIKGTCFSVKGILGPGCEPMFEPSRGLVEYALNHQRLLLRFKDNHDATWVMKNIMKQHRNFAEVFRIGCMIKNNEVVSHVYVNSLAEYNFEHTVKEWKHEQACAKKECSMEHYRFGRC